MPYSYDTFIRSSSSDINIKIYDISGNLCYTINPFSVINIQVNNNLIKINLKELSDILLDFDNPTESKIALQSLKIQLDTLRQKSPLFIDDKIGEFVVYNGPSAGTNPDFGILSNGKIIQISVLSGSSPIENSNIAIISLQNPRSYDIYPIVSPGNNNAISSNVYCNCVDRKNININTTGTLVDSTLYVFNILI